MNETSDVKKQGGGPAHALLSASSAARWLNCTASARMCENAPDGPSQYAAEGTLAHKFAENALRYRAGMVRAAEWRRRREALAGDPMYAPEMEDHAEDWAARVADGGLAELRVWTERRLDYSRWAPGGFGTADAVTADPKNGILKVFDYKYGMGVPVSATWNPQLMLYAAAALNSEEDGFARFPRVELVIFQPRIENSNSFGLSSLELLDWCDSDVRPRARAAWTGGGDPVPGDWCRFCRVKGTCAALAARYRDLARRVSDDPRSMTLGEIGDVLREARGIDEWLDDVRAAAVAAILDGRSVPGWKTVRGRSLRKWTDESAVAGRAPEGVEIWERKLISPAKLEKAVGKKRFAEEFGGLVEVPEPRPALAEEGDRRPAWVPGTDADDFATIEPQTKK